ILNGALPGLSKRERTWLDLGSFSVDFSILGQMASSRAYQHGMRAPNETREDAANSMGIFVFEHGLAAATAAAKAGYMDSNTLYEFGKAMHPLMDSTSPTHAAGVYFGIPSNFGLGTLGLLFDLVGLQRHKKLESRISLELYHKNIDRVRLE